MTCRELAELLCDFLQDECPPEQRCLIEQHLVVCPHCGVFLETYRLTIQITRCLPGKPLPSTLQQRLRALLEQPPGE